MCCRSVLEFLLSKSTVTILKIQIHEKFAVITLKFEQGGFTIEWCIQKMQRELQTV